MRRIGVADLSQDKVFNFEFLSQCDGLVSAKVRGNAALEIGGGIKHEGVDVFDNAF